MNASTTMSPGESLARRRIGPLILIGLGVFILGVAGWLTMSWSDIGRADMTLPTSLAGLSRSSYITGQAALAEIEQLHGKSFPMTGGAVARYGGNGATLWISGVWLPFMAARQVEVMTEGIAEGRSPFTPTETREIEGVTVYALTGMGQMHYYFQLDRRVAWLAVSPQLAEQSLEELIRTLR